mmetsp:Transcript_8431/g.23715  ORF Transcript_8431/g.23715 Transcript_8431/m.23715 type:complete len:335 (+) Transcript_8431:219-1223(+)
MGPTTGRCAGAIDLGCGCCSGATCVCGGCCCCAAGTSGGAAAASSRAFFAAICSCLAASGSLMNLLILTTCLLIPCHDGPTFSPESWRNQWTSLRRFLASRLSWSPSITRFWMKLPTASLTFCFCSSVAEASMSFTFVSRLDRPLAAPSRPCFATFAAPLICPPSSRNSAGSARVTAWPRPARICLGSSAGFLCASSNQLSIFFPQVERPLAACSSGSSLLPSRMALGGWVSAGFIESIMLPTPSSTCAMALSPSACAPRARVLKKLPLRCCGMVSGSSSPRRISPVGFDDCAVIWTMASTSSRLARAPASRQQQRSRRPVVAMAAEGRPRWEW